MPMMPPNQGNYPDQGNQNFGNSPMDQMQQYQQFPGQFPQHGQGYPQGFGQPFGGFPEQAQQDKGKDAGFGVQQPPHQLNGNFLPPPPAGLPQGKGDLVQDVDHSSSSAPVTEGENVEVNSVKENSESKHGPSQDEKDKLE